MGYSKDCNSNQIPDECDVRTGFSTDVNENEVPDECEPSVNLPFVRGDANGDGRINISDPIRVLRALFVPDSQDLGCGDAADFDDSGDVNVADSIYGTKRWLS